MFLKDMLLEKEALLVHYNIAELKSEIEKLKSKLNAASIIIDTARNFIVAGQQKEARTKAFQEAASIARKGGPSGTAIIKNVERNNPVVIDIGDAYNAIKSAIAKFDKLEK